VLDRSWVQRIATDWLAWQMTHSTLWVGVIAFCTLVPSVVISPIAGAVADRVDRVKLIAMWARTWLRLGHLAPALEGLEAPAE
jgi:MFS family permease